MRKIFFSVVFAMVCAGLHAQQSGTFRTKIVSSSSDTIPLDTMVLFKGSVIVSSGGKIFSENKDYRVDYLHSKLILILIPPKTELRISYKVILLDIAKPLAHKDPAIIQKEYIDFQNPYMYTPGASNATDIFKNDGLKMNGSLSRGLSFGNNQNVVLNSNLNLQLAGKINGDIDILAAVSDENNPIQPEGNTSSLQDFDKVFIQLSRQKTKLIVGDFEMMRPLNSYFMNYFKKSRGLQLQTGFDLGKDQLLKVGADAAISRGRFSRNIINGIEGNQGPYRLSGTNGETFIIIISGTEAVYLDGEKLTRGEQNDFIVDYNSGEITFMPKRVITQYSRIIVEFQYSDKNYSRSVFHMNTEFEQKNKYRIRANYFMEQDNKDQPLLQNLSDSDKAILASVGNNLSQAVAPAATKTNIFSTSKILYRKIDSTIVSTVYPGIYVFTSDPNSDSVFYQVTFSYMGTGKGNYVLASSAANGRVFNWVQPQNGVLMGDYEPVTQLVSPKRMQMYTFGADILAIKNTKISVEYARSDYDKNLFSNFDKATNGGNGIKVSGTNVIPLEQKPKDFWNLKTDASFESVDQNFRFIERYRDVEFDRTWNRQLSNQTTANTDTGFKENIFSGKASLNKSSIGNLFYQFGYYERAGIFSGLQSYAGTNLRFMKNILNTEYESISSSNKSSGQEINNEVSRYKIDYGRVIYKTIAGVIYTSEKSNFKRSDDTLQQGSFYYTQESFYVKNADSMNIKYKADFSQRDDYLPSNTGYLGASTGRNLNGNIEWIQKNFNRLSATFNYRDFIVKDTTFTKLKPEQTILSRVEYDYRFLKRVFTANTYYQLGSGNELRRDYQYIEVPAGQGIYVWKDFNGDGKQELNEFVVASFLEKNQANFIKVFLPTTSTVRINSTQFNQTLNINPSAVWNNKTGWKKFIGRWNNQTALKIDRKTTVLDTKDFFNPFKLNVLDSQLISMSSTIRNTLFFNRSDPTFGFDINYQDNRTKIFQTNGFDSKHRTEQGLNARWNFSSVWGITTGFTYGNRSFYSDLFSTNDYNYSFYSVNPKLIFQMNKNFRVTLVFSYFEGNNDLNFGGQIGTNRETGTELRYNVGTTGALTGKFSLYKVSFSGDNVSSPVGYDMLNGFLVGQNTVWNVSFQQRLGKNLQINLNYDGRKSETSNIIHVGRMEARYIF
ncbi:MAG: hypothetical protein ACHQK8_02420 [Bacteroidia bacterium]